MPLEDYRSREQYFLSGYCEECKRSIGFVYDDYGKLYCDDCYFEMISLSYPDLEEEYVSLGNFIREQQEEIHGND